ncbi:hypothetical protein Pcinc_012142 [Petrolisthes cinctipes]|uniref:Uncharacterized protein n=1 Tax=Petrolisthes cinctipes TaxID=88211 RepID=A0AAE1KTT9_PETCI|nr:hypothetical protein Pcinc_012142 [Petrolisthes cinctipes]
MIQKVQNTVGAELRKNRGASFCKFCSVFLTHHKKIQPLLKLLLLEELYCSDCGIITSDSSEQAFMLTSFPTHHLRQDVLKP